MWEICAFSMHSLHHLLPPLRKCNNLRGHKTVATHMSFLSIPEIFTKRHLLFKHCIWIYYFIYIWFCFLSFTVLLIFICCNGCIDVHLTRLINITYVLISLTLNLLVSGHEPCNIGVIGQTVSGSQWVMGNHLWPTACSGCRRSAAAAGGNETNRQYVRRRLYIRVPNQTIMCNGGARLRESPAGLKQPSLKQRSFKPIALSLALNQQPSGISLSDQPPRPTQPGHPSMGRCNEYWRIAYGYLRSLPN